MAGSSKGRGPNGTRIEPRLYGSTPSLRADPDDRARGSARSRQKNKPEPREPFRRGSGSRHRSWIGRLVSLVFTLGFIGLVVAGLGVAYIWQGLKDQGLLHIPDRAPGILLLASDGSTLASRGAFQGDDVRVDELPSYVPNAIIAIEDRRFRDHYGVDPRGFARAMWTNVKARRFVEGGSTLSQQLAKNLFLQPDRTFMRKAQEAVLAVWLESNFTKDEILQLYMNRVEFKPGTVGIDKAALAYFGKSARDINLHQAAILAGALKAPSTYNPLLHPEAAAQRARAVLHDMAEVGFITNQQAADATSAPLATQADDYVSATQYVVDWALAMLPDLVKTTDTSIIIETTINPPMQANAEKNLRAHLDKDGKRLNVSQGAIVVLDTAGAVKALVGGRSWRQSQFNRVTMAKRQPGSSFKPFVYLTAIEHGFAPDTLVTDAPIKIGNWEPENYKHKYLGQVSLTRALALSLNTVAVKLGVDLGPATIVETAHRLGISSKLEANASIALGTSEVSLLELTSAMTPFANGGQAVSPWLISRITTREGTVLYERRGSGLGQVAKPFDVAALNQMMRAVITEGTGMAARLAGMTMAGKTGTSQDYRDAWFIGYTPYYVAGVWLGNDDNSPTNKVTGGTVPAQIWKELMGPAHAGLADMRFPGDEVFDSGGEMARTSQTPQGTQAAQETVQGREPDVDAGNAGNTRRSGGLLESIFGSSNGDEGENESATSDPMEDRPASAYQRSLKPETDPFNR